MDKSQSNVDYRPASTVTFAGFATVLVLPETRIWQLAILDDSFDNLSARYARSVGELAPGPALASSLHFSPLIFWPDSKRPATPSHLCMIISSAGYTCYASDAARAEVLRERPRVRRAVTG